MCDDDDAGGVGGGAASAAVRVPLAAAQAPAAPTSPAHPRDRARQQGTDAIYTRASSYKVLPT